MENNNSSDSSSNTITDSFLNHKSKKIPYENKINEFIKNPLINHFTPDSIFIFDKTDFAKYFSNLKNKNLIKLTNTEITFLKSISKDIELKIKILDNNSFIFVNKNICENLKKFFNVNNELNERALFFQKEIITCKNRCNLSCRKLANTYFLKTGIKIGKTTVKNIIRKELGYHYLKTVYKSNFLKCNK